MKKILAAVSVVAVMLISENAVTKGECDIEGLIKIPGEQCFEEEKETGVGVSISPSQTAHDIVPTILPEKISKIVCTEDDENTKDSLIAEKNDESTVLLPSETSVPENDLEVCGDSTVTPILPHFVAENIVVTDHPSDDNEQKIIAENGRDRDGRKNNGKFDEILTEHVPISNVDTEAANKQAKYQGLSNYGESLQADVSSKEEKSLNYERKLKVETLIDEEDRGGVYRNNSASEIVTNNVPRSIVGESEELSKNGGFYSHGENIKTDSLVDENNASSLKEKDSFDYEGNLNVNMLIDGEENSKGVELKINGTSEIVTNNVPIVDESRNVSEDRVSSNYGENIKAHKLVDVDDVRNSDGYRTKESKQHDGVIFYEAETEISAKRFDILENKESVFKTKKEEEQHTNDGLRSPEQENNVRGYDNFFYSKGRHFEDSLDNKDSDPSVSGNRNFSFDTMVNDNPLKDELLGRSFYNRNKEDGSSKSCSDCDLGILPVSVAASSKAADRERESSSPFSLPYTIPEASLQFADVPAGDDLRVDELGLSEGTFLFSYLGELLSWLQPNDFPVELMRGALRNQISIIDLISQSLRVEAGFVACLIIGVLLALAAPIAVLAHTCYRIRRRKGDDSEETPIGWAGNCRRRTLVFILQILIILLFIGTAAMVVTNEQVSTAVLQAGHVLRTVLNDLDTFLHNAHLQLHFAVSKHLDQAVQAVNNDLENVEVLLGQPIQAELSKETGVDVALESLRDIAQDASKVGEVVELVQLAAGLVGEAVLLSRERLSDLRLQIDTFRRQCPSRDRPLCDTLNVAGLDVTLNIDFLRQDEKLKRVRQIGGPELRGEVETARMLYRDIPRQVDSDTREARQAVRRQLAQQQMQIDNNIRALEALVRNLRGKVMSSQNTLQEVTVNIPEIEFWRWIIGLGAAGSLTLLWLLLQSGISCGCCGSEKSAGPTLLVCVIMICLVSTALWFVALIVLLVGGHGQVFICRPLYQDPDFQALSQLLDNPGLFQGSHKFLSSLAYNNETLDVPLNHVLQECQANKAVYPIFHLEGLFNVDSMTEPREWDILNDKMRNINVRLDYLKLLSPALHNQLNDLLQGLSVNLTAHRTQLSGSVTGKDLNSFAAQLDSVGNQIKDLATASRMETLASRIRRLIATHIEPLKEKKENLMYQLTALEVQLIPLQRQVEQSISHLKTIQFFINNQGNSIAERKTEEYTYRLMRYIDLYRISLSDKINNNLARCHPLWKLFHTSRLMLCKHIIDPLNGFWFSMVWCLIVLLCATPICLKLVDCYKLKSHSNSVHTSGSPTENLMANEQGRDWSSSNGNSDSGGGW